MGYDVYYDLKVKCTQKERSLLYKDLLDILNREFPNTLYSYRGIDFEGEVNEIIREDHRWYNSFDNLSELAKLYPTAELILYSKGEEGEECIEYFKNDFYQESPGKVLFEPFNPEKLKYYVVRYKIRDGNNEYYTTTITTIKKNLKKELHNYFKDFFFNGTKYEDDAYWSGDGCQVLTIQDCTEITLLEKEFLNKIGIY